MGTGERTKNSAKNIMMNAIVQVVTLLVSMISRRVFINTLGSEYLGINGLFGNILSILSLTELGISSAIMYNLYRPLAENNYRKVAQLINYYKRLYTSIGYVVFFIGILLMPFLEYILNLETAIPYINSYYFLFLMNSVLSYFFVYKTAVMIADQKNYQLSIITISVNIIKLIAQIIVLTLFGSYMLYLVMQLFFGIAGNYISSRYAEIKYPYIRERVFLDKEEKKSIFSHVKDMFSYQVGSVILNNTDNILISVIDNTKMVGLYSNYSVLIQAISSFTSMVFTSINASIGNFLVKAKAESQYNMFKLLTFLAFWIYTFASVGIFSCLELVIDIWIGEQYIVSKSLLYVCIFNFYVTGILYPIWSYRNTVGLFRQTKNIMFYTSAINIILSVLLGKIWGINGVLLATGIARIFTTIWYEPYILFKVYFNQSKKQLYLYYFRQIVYGIELIVVLITMNYLNRFIDINNSYLNLFIRLSLCIIVPNLFIILFHYKCKEFQGIIYYGINLINNKRKKTI